MRLGHEGGDDGRDRLALGHADVIVAGGMESMSNAPYLLPQMRGGARIGHAQAIDHMFLDGLEDAYDKGRLMGTFAEDCAEAYQFTPRGAGRICAALADAGARGAGGRPSTPRSCRSVRPAGRATAVVSIDEQPGAARPEKIPQLKPAFREGGTVTPANSSSISDGAAALVMERRAAAEAARRCPSARILGHASHAQAPGLFTTAPVPAARKLLERFGWDIADVDLWEVNEAFAVVPMAFMAEMGLDPEGMNVERRGLRARPSDRRLGHAHHRDAAARAGGARAEARGRGDLHRRRRGNGGRGRAALTPGTVQPGAPRRLARAGRRSGERVSCPR